MPLVRPMLFWESICVSILTVSNCNSVNIQKARLCYSNERNLLKKYAKTLAGKDTKLKTKKSPSLLKHWSAMMTSSEWWRNSISRKLSKVRPEQTNFGRETKHFNSIQFLNRQKQNNKITLSEIIWKRNYKGTGKRGRARQFINSQAGSKLISTSIQTPQHTSSIHHQLPYTTSTARVTWT